MRSLHRAPWGIRQHATHRALIRQARQSHAGRSDLKLDAIIVPASRPAAHLDHAITLARAADCWLLILCSQHIRGTAAKDFLAARSYQKAIVVDVPPGYSHPLFEFPGLQSIRRDLPEACGYYPTDLSMKRNIGLVMARMLRWDRIFFLDDDIRDIAFPNLQATVNLLASYPAAGLWVAEYPDNSIACHANRMTESSQDVFVSGAALAVDVTADIGFFPDIYNEDWLFFFDHTAQGKLANSGLRVTQLTYDPFVDPGRAAWQEFGDVLAEGLYAMLHRGLAIHDATRSYWVGFLEARREFLEAIISRSDSAPEGIRDELREAVQQSIKCLLTIKPEVCEQYIQLWRKDLAAWKWRAGGISAAASVEEALSVLRLEPAQSTSGTGWLPSAGSAEPLEVRAGAVAVPWFGTMEKLPTEVGATPRRSSSAAEVGTDTVPFPVVTGTFAPEEQAARASDVDLVGGRQRKQRIGDRVNRLVTPLRRRRAPAHLMPEENPEQTEPGGVAEAAASTVAAPE